MIFMRIAHIHTVTYTHTHTHTLKGIDKRGLRGAKAAEIDLIQFG